MRGSLKEISPAHFARGIEAAKEVLRLQYFYEDFDRFFWDPIMSGTLAQITHRFAFEDYHPDDLLTRRGLQFKALMGKSPYTDQERERLLSLADAAAGRDKDDERVAPLPARKQKTPPPFRPSLNWDDPDVEMK